ncbi:nucleoside-diphosphate kinase [Chytriomyces confervae]|uniref:Nucleoside diphosphate kinase n=1 Tax=Chytriomyces confervae TaxID=246404 RepID=A0A507FK83_9FUNG|nr:nucleoside-diphosphate kinase [Chytriomyces confervae]
MASKKVEVAPVMAAAHNNAEFLSMIGKPGLIAKFAGPCEAMQTILRRYKVDYGENISFVQAITDNISCFEHIRNQSCPVFAFFFGKLLIRVVRGANAPFVERTIKEQMQLEEHGLPHVQCAPDELTRPIIDFLNPPEPEPTVQETPQPSKSNPSSRRESQLDTRRASTSEASAQAQADMDIDRSNHEQTFAMLKPDAMMPSILEEVVSSLYRHRIHVLQVKKIWLTKEQAQELYKEAAGMDYFDRLVDYISCAPVLAFELSKENVIEEWRQIVGPRDPKDAKLDAPKSLRGMYGNDRLMNSFHASDGPVSAARELAFIFGPETQFNTLEYTPPTNPKSSQSNGLLQKTLAVIKPEAMLRVDDIISRIVSRGYKVAKKDEFLLNVERAQELSLEFLETPLFEESVQSLMSAPVLCLMIKGENAIEGWMEMLGPSDPELARKTCPMSLRAQFGLTISSNGVHGSQTVDLAIQQLQSFFPHYLNTNASRSSIFKSPIGSLQASRAGSKAQLVSSSMRMSFAILEHQRMDNAAKAAEEEIRGWMEDMPPFVERTLALIKPDAYPDKKQAIVDRIFEDGFSIIEQREIQFSLETAQEFYKEHAEKEFYGQLTGWMSSAPIYALVLEKTGGVQAWRNLAGPTNSEKAREESSTSIRALFGTDGSLNAVHGSDSTTSADREINLVFGGEVSSMPPLQTTLALIKPDAYPAHKNHIANKLKQCKLTILNEKELHMTLGMAQEFYREHEGKPFFEDLTTWMSSAPIYAMVLEGPSGVKAWRNLAGPTNSETARETAPWSIRAKFGTDGSTNAVHGSDSPESAEREINIIFNINTDSQVATTKPDTAVDLGSVKKLNLNENHFPSGPGSRSTSLRASLAQSRASTAHLLNSSLRVENSYQQESDVQNEVQQQETPPPVPVEDASHHSQGNLNLADDGEAEPIPSQPEGVSEETGSHEAGASDAINLENSETPQDAVEAQNLEIEHPDAQVDDSKHELGNEKDASDPSSDATAILASDSSHTLAQ